MTSWGVRYLFRRCGIVRYIHARYHFLVTRVAGTKKTSDMFSNWGISHEFPGASKVLSFIFEGKFYIVVTGLRSTPT